jgi:hypothetical protein
MGTCKWEERGGAGRGGEWREGVMGDRMDAKRYRQFERQVAEW